MRIPFRLPPHAQRPFDVVGFGLNSIDLLAVVAEYPACDSKQPLQRFARLPGGEMATAMTACAKLGWSARYVGSFGDDEFGRLSRESLTDAGVSIEGSRTVPGAKNQFAVILVEAVSGRRTICWDRDPRLIMAPAEVPRDAVVSGRLLVVDAVQTAAATSAVRAAREAGIPTIIDIDKVRPGTSDLLRSIDAIIVAESFLPAFTGFDDLGRALEAIAREFDAPLVCATLGDEGSLTRVNGREIRTPAFAVDTVDTTGAGDAFRGGFASACLANPEGEIEDVLAYANAVAALNCRALGARGGLPTRSEVDGLLSTLDSRR